MHILSAGTSAVKQLTAESGDAAEPAIPRSLQLGVLRLGMLENRDFVVGVLPEREEITSMQP